MKTVQREIELLSVAIANYEAYDRADGRIYHVQPYSPPRPLIFSAFRFDESNIRVVILGQDPYPGFNRETGLPDATGSAFSCPKANGITGSMNNVFMQIFNTWEKLRRYDKTLGEYVKPTHCDLTAWQEQGVFLFNLCPMLLYNSRNPVNPWIFFTVKLLRHLAKRKIVWLLLGRSAQSIIPQLKDFMGSSYNDELIICAPHPSNRNASNDFTRGNCFLHINLVLLRMGQPPINWSIT
jgi:uracil-DNA glycosylase